MMDMIILPAVIDSAVARKHHVAAEASTADLAALAVAAGSRHRRWDYYKTRQVETPAARFRPVAMSGPGEEHKTVVRRQELRAVGG